MSRPALVFAISFALLFLVRSPSGSPPIVSAQDSADMTPDDAARAELEAFVSRVERAYVDPDAVRFEFVWTREVPGEETHRLSGTATLVSPDDDRAYGIRIEGVRGAAERDSFRLQRMEDRIEFVDFAERTLWHATVMRAGISLLRSEAGPLYSIFRDPGRLAEAIDHGLGFRGTATIDGAPCRRLELVFPSGTVEIWYVDERSAVIRQHEKRSAESRGGGTDVLVMRAHRPVPAASIDHDPLLVPRGFESHPYVPSGPAPGEPAPSWNLVALSGEQLSLAALRGRVVVLDFWATWCVPCRQSIPDLQALHDERSDQELLVVGATWKETGDPEAFLAEHGVTYEIVDGSSIGEAYGMNDYGLPTVFVIDREGRVADLSSGYRAGWSERWLRETVEAALNGN